MVPVLELALGFVLKLALRSVLALRLALKLALELVLKFAQGWGLARAARVTELRPRPMKMEST